MYKYTQKRILGVVQFVHISINSKITRKKNIAGKNKFREQILFAQKYFLTENIQKHIVVNFNCTFRLFDLAIFPSDFIENIYFICPH